MTTTRGRRTYRSCIAGFTFLLLAILVMGCGGSGHGDVSAPITGGTGSGGGSAALTAANSLYVVQLGNSFFLPATPAYLLQYPKTATGKPNPATSITSPSQILFGGVAMDSTGKLYVAATPASATNQTQIFVYQVGASGTATPTTYPTPEPGLSTFNVGLDNNVYLTAGNTIWQTSAGTVTRTIQGPAQELTGADDLYDARGIAADASGTIYVVNGDPLQQGSNPVLIYAAGSSGKTLPSATIEGSKTGFTTASAVALDHAGNIYVGTSTAVLVFAPGATGNVAPVRVIQGSATTLNGILDLKVDSAGTLFVLSGFGIGTQTVLTFAPGAAGNVAPLTALGPQTLPDNVQQTFGGIAVM